jgi:hypothetical protein
LLNEKHSSKEVNATSFGKHFKLIFYACKHKYITKTNKKQLKHVTGPAFGLEKYLE